MDSEKRKIQTYDLLLLLATWIQLPLTWEVPTPLFLTSFHTYSNYLIRADKVI